MTDEQKNKSSDEEYQFPKDEYVSPEASHDEEKEAAPGAQRPSSRLVHLISLLPKNLSDFKNKRILFIIGGVIILILFIHFIRTTTKETPQLAPIATQPAQSTQVTQSNDVQTTLGVLQQSGSQTQTEIQTLKSQLLDMQNNMDQLQAQNQQLQQSIATLTTQLQDLTSQLNNALTRIRPGRSARHIVYHLRAVVPDRAWIATGRGQGISVTVGNHIPQYGVVRSIDSQNGIVTTSSGRVIKYGVNDY